MRFLDFLNRVLPMMKGDVAQTIKTPKNAQLYVGSETVADSVNDTETTAEPAAVSDQDSSAHAVEIPVEGAPVTGTEQENPLITPSRVVFFI